MTDSFLRKEHNPLISLDRTSNTTRPIGRIVDVSCNSNWIRVATNLENLEYSGISLNVENSGGILREFSATPGKNCNKQSSFFSLSFEYLVRVRWWRVILLISAISWQTYNIPEKGVVTRSLSHAPFYNFTPTKISSERLKLDSTVPASAAWSPTAAPWSTNPPTPSIKFSAPKMAF